MPLRTFAFEFVDAVWQVCVGFGRLRGKNRHIRSHSYEPELGVFVVPGDERYLVQFPAVDLFERIYEIAVEIVGIAVITVVIVNYYEPANLVVFVVFAAVEPER